MFGSSDPFASMFGGSGFGGGFGGNMLTNFNNMGNMGNMGTLGNTGNMGGSNFVSTSYYSSSGGPNGPVSYSSS